VSFPAPRIDAERRESVGGALRGVQEFPARGEVQVRGPDVVVGVARRRTAGRADSAARRAGHTSFESGGSAVAELTSVSNPVFASSESVVTVATSSDRRYTNLLSARR